MNLRKIKNSSSLRRVNFKKQLLVFGSNKNKKNGVGEKLGKAWLPPRNDSLEGIPDIAHVSTVNIVWSLRNFFLWFTPLFFSTKS